MDQSSPLTLLFEGMTAVGTLLVAALALFGPTVRAWMMRPRLLLSVGTKPPYAEKLEIDLASTSGQRSSYYIRLMVRNTGRDSAKRCTVTCGSIFKQRAGGSGYYLWREFVPRKFYWTSDEQSTEIIPSLPAYLNLASISRTESPAPSGGGVHALMESSDLKLHILVDEAGKRGRLMNVETGRVLFPLAIHSDNLRASERRYVEIFWDGKSFEDFSDQHFKISLLSERDGQRAAGGAK